MENHATAPDVAAIPAAFVSEEFAGTGIVIYFEGPGGEEMKARVNETQLAALSPEPGQTFRLS